MSLCLITIIYYYSVGYKTFYLNFMRKISPFAFITGGIVLGIAISVLIGYKNSKLNLFPLDEQQAKDELLNSYLDEQSYLQSRIASLRKDIGEKYDILENRSRNSNLELLNGLKKSIGLTVESGLGIEILLSDSPLINRADIKISADQLILASDVRDIINLLNASGIKAISVNKERVIATSPITAIGNTILINNAHISPPYTIEAVGDSRTIGSSVQRIVNQDLLQSFYERVKNNHIGIKVTLTQNTLVPAYTGSLRTNMINLVN